jgi:hypothetical protein
MMTYELFAFQVIISYLPNQDGRLTTKRTRSLQPAPMTTTVTLSKLIDHACSFLFSLSKDTHVGLLFSPKKISFQ